MLRGAPVDHCLAMHASMSSNEIFCSRPMLSRAPPSPKNEYGLVGALQYKILVSMPRLSIFLLSAATQAWRRRHAPVQIAAITTRLDLACGA